jgi:hypothetical protein
MNTQLHLFRMVDGERRAVTLTIDPSRLILSEELGSSPILLGSSTDDREANLIHRGVGFHKDEQGRTIIDSVPAREQEVISFFSLTKPCWFEGCEELRKEYLAEYEAIGGANCQACDHGALIRKFMPKIDAILPLAEGVAPLGPIPQNITPA